MGESVWSWSTTAADNNDADTSINWAEGMPPGEVNDSARSMMAAHSKYVKDTTGAITLDGSANTYTVTSYQGLAALADGVRIHAVVNATNTGASTLNVDGLGAKAIRVIAGSADQALVGGELAASGHAIFQYDASANSAAGAWILLNPVFGIATIASGSFPSAAVLDITSIPSTYRMLQLFISNASSDTGTRRPQVQLSVDNGSSFISSTYTGVAYDGTTVTGLSGVFAAPAGTIAAAADYDMLITMTGFQAGLYPSCYFTARDSAGLDSFGNGSYIGATTLVNAIRIGWNGSGNFDGGTYALRGIV